MQSTNVLHIKSDVHFQKPQVDNNYIIHSKVHAFEKQDNNSALSVKLVLQGTERYRINNKRYDLCPGEFLVVDQQQELNISFNENTIAEGMCFYFDRKYLDQVFSLSQNGEDWGLDNYGSAEKAHTLLSGKYKVNEFGFGQHLKKAAETILRDEQSFVAEDFFLDIAERLVHQQKNVFTKVNRLSSTKLSTRQELYTRAAKAKYYIEDHVTETIRIEELTTVASLSEVQLHRAFKQVYQTTPYQYILSTKLNRAAQLIRAGHQSISDISILLGFSDLATFSKAFKRKFGITPTAFQ